MHRPDIASVGCLVDLARPLAAGTQAAARVAPRRRMAAVRRGRLTMSRGWRGLVALMVTCLVASPVVAEEEQPVGTVEMEIKSVALLIGATWGEGKLVYGGKKYTFSISGVSLIDVGVSNLRAKGGVRHLRQIADFSGTYAAAAVGAIVGGGASAITMQNEHGVTLELTGVGQGLQLTLAVRGFRVKLE